MDDHEPSPADNPIEEPADSPIEETAAICERILDALETVVVGKRVELELILGGLLAGGHVLLEDLRDWGRP